tara:strand:- start:449 stop:916 length:468 start_codon:yes stop_codon:yes gene_type:complete
MIKVNVITNNSKWFNFIKDPDRYLQLKIKKLNTKNKQYKKKKFFCTLLLSSDDEIKKLNKKFRKKNKITDVLSFPFQNKQDFKKILKKETEIYLGDVIINLNKIKSKKEIKNFKNEFDRLWIHGLVHLFGYDHVKVKDFLAMSRIEKKYFKLINV